AMASLVPAPDSAVACNLRSGKSQWADWVHLLWSAWLFITPLFGGGHYTSRWMILTATTFPLFLALYARTLLAPRRAAWRYPLGMVGLCLVLLPWYPSGLSYFVFGCVMLSIGRRDSLLRYLFVVLLLNAVLAAVATWAGYGWQTLVWMLPMTMIIGTIVNVEAMQHEKDAALQLSHDEVRRLAATAERERIGRDPDAARREIGEAEKVARHALAEVRSAVTGFRAADLAAELASARLLLESSGVAFEYECPPPLGAELERPLALVLREAATNIARHADATHARIDFGRENGRLRMRIADNGRGGIDVEGNGLAGIRERVR